MSHAKPPTDYAGLIGSLLFVAAIGYTVLQLVKGF